MTIEEAIKLAIKGGWDFYRDQIAEGETKREFEESKKSIPNPDSVSIDDGEDEFEIHGEIIHLHWDDEDAVGWENQDLAWPLEKTMYLNPLFWQSLGKAMGFGDVKAGGVQLQDFIAGQRNWDILFKQISWGHFQMLRFTDFLAENKTPQDFFTTLTSPKE